MSPPPLLSIRNLSKRFPGVVALDGVDFTVRSGEIHALLGENGAGKSTLIKVLTGVYPADSGETWLGGKRIALKAPKEAELAGISTVYQEVNLVPSLSVAENITLGRQPRRFGLLDWRGIRARARAALARLEIECDVEAELGSLSIAHQQMIALARALDTSARLLILDEPTASLDDKEVEELFTVMRRLRMTGMGIVFVTHFLDQVYAVCDRITVLRNGRLAGEYVPAQLTRLELVGKMLGRDATAPDSASLAPAVDVPGRRTVLAARQLGRRGGVSPLDLTLHTGEVVGLGGLLGSGRTETARLLFGVDQADQGTITVGGEQVVFRTPRDAVRRHLAFCSEDRKTEGILPNLSVRENLIVALQGKRGLIRPLRRAEQKKLCDHYIRALRIKTSDTEVPIKNLSGGNQQKVLLARWLATQPALIILDEPTRGIDIGAKQEIEQLIARLRAEGLAVLFISSEVDEMIRNCSRIQVLRERRPAGVLADEAVTPARLMSLMAGTPDGT